MGELEISGVLETVLYCTSDDEGETRDFYRRVLGLRPVGLDGDAFRVSENQMLLLFNRERSTVQEDPPAHGATGPVHTCFMVPPGQYAAWKRRVEVAGAVITREITWGNGVTSFYFDDPAGNVLEIADGDLWPR